MTHTEFCVRAVEGRPACCLPAWKILPPCNVASGHLELLVTQKPLAKLDFKHQASRGSGLRAFFPPRLAWGPLAGGPCLRTRTFPPFLLHYGCRVGGGALPSHSGSRLARRGSGKLSPRLCSALRVSSVLQALRAGGCSWGIWAGRDSHTQTSFSSSAAVAQGSRMLHLVGCGVMIQS